MAIIDILSCNIQFCIDKEKVMGLDSQSVIDNYLCFLINMFLTPKMSWIVHCLNNPHQSRSIWKAYFWTAIAYAIISRYLSLAAMSSSSSDHVTLFVRPSVRSFVRSKCFFDFAFISLLGQDLWHWWSLKWPIRALKAQNKLGWTGSSSASIGTKTS